MNRKLRVKRKVVYKQVQTFTRQKADYHFTLGLKQASSIALNRYANIYQLKALAEEYKDLFRQEHPTHNWHVNGTKFVGQAPIAHNTGIGAADESGTDSVYDDHDASVAQQTTDAEAADEA